VFWLEQIVLLKASNSFFVDSDDTDFNSGGPRPGKGPQPVPLQFFFPKVPVHCRLFDYKKTIYKHQWCMLQQALT
jgi:hypothetical protein